VETIILASKSLNRSRLLEQVGIPYKVLSPAFREEDLAAREISQRVMALAQAKVRSVLPDLNGEAYRWIVGCDTLIESEGLIFGKPADRHEAKRMLESLSGRIHRVLTGIALLPSKDGKISLDYCTSIVHFNEMTEEETEYYLSTEEWRGAAGAYRIQNRGAFFVKSLEGSYSNVVGLPLSLLYGMLRDAGYSFS
jgi:septum formation protein